MPDFFLFFFHHNWHRPLKGCIQSPTTNTKKKKIQERIVIHTPAWILCTGFDMVQSRYTLQSIAGLMGGKNCQQTKTGGGPFANRGPTIYLQTRTCASQQRWINKWLRLNMKGPHFEGDRSCGLFSVKFRYIHMPGKARQRDRWKKQDALFTSLYTAIAA